MSRPQLDSMVLDRSATRKRRKPRIVILREPRNSHSERSASASEPESRICHSERSASASEPESRNSHSERRASASEPESRNSHSERRASASEPESKNPYPVHSVLRALWPFYRDVIPNRRRSPVRACPEQAKRAEGNPLSSREIRSLVAP